MSRRTILNRRVVVIPRAAGARDARGNRTFADGTPVAPVRARRSLADATEDTVGREQQTRDWIYVLELRADDGPRTPVVLDGHAVIDDDEERFEIIGDPELVHRRRRPSHWYARAQRVEG